MTSNFVPAYLGGSLALSTHPVVGSPEVERPEIFLPGTEDLAEGEIRVSVLGSGLPWVTKSQASESVLMEVGNPEKDVFVFDLGSGSLANFSGLQVPVTSRKSSELLAKKVGSGLSVSCGDDPRV